MSPPPTTHDQEGKPVDGTARAGRRFASTPVRANGPRRDVDAFGARTGFADGVMAPIGELVGAQSEHENAAKPMVAPIGEVAAEEGERAAAVPDLYIDGLRERARRERETQGLARPPSPPSRVATELSDFFDQQASADPCPGGGQALPAGSASLDPALAPASRTQVRTPRSARATRRGMSPETEKPSRSRRGARCLGVSTLGAAVCVVVALTSGGGGSGAAPARSASADRGTHLAVALPKLRAIRARGASRAPAASEASARRTRRTTPRGR